MDEHERVPGIIPVERNAHKRALPCLLTSNSGFTPVEKRSRSLVSKQLNGTVVYVCIIFMVYTQIIFSNIPLIGNND